jgi:hypothetical protein
MNIVVGAWTTCRSDDHIAKLLVLGAGIKNSPGGPGSYALKDSGVKS